MIELEPIDLGGIEKTWLDSDIHMVTTCDEMRTILRGLSEKFMEKIADNIDPGNMEHLILGDRICIEALREGAVVYVAPAGDPFKENGNPDWLSIYAYKARWSQVTVTSDLL